MLIPEGGPPGEIVINQCVLQQVVTHVQSVDGLTPDGQVRLAEWWERYSRSPMSRFVGDGRSHEVGERPAGDAGRRARLSAQGVQSETSHGR